MPNNQIKTKFHSAATARPSTAANVHPISLSQSSRPCRSCWRTYTQYHSLRDCITSQRRAQQTVTDKQNNIESLVKNHGAKIRSTINFDNIFDTIRREFCTPYPLVTPIQELKPATAFRRVIKKAYNNPIQEFVKPKSPLPCSTDTRKKRVCYQPSIALIEAYKRRVAEQRR